MRALAPTSTVDPSANATLALPSAPVSSASPEYRRMSAASGAARAIQPNHARGSAGLDDARGHRTNLHDVERDAQSHAGHEPIGRRQSVQALHLLPLVRAGEHLATECPQGVARANGVDPLGGRRRCEGGWLCQHLNRCERQQQYDAFEPVPFARWDPSCEKIDLNTPFWAVRRALIRMCEGKTGKLCSFRMSSAGVDGFK
jgi:hypothetical protein